MEISFLSHSEFTTELLKEAYFFESRYFFWPWKEEDWLQLSSDFYICIAKNGETLEAVALWEKSEWDEVAHLHKIVVAPHMRSRAIGKRLLEMSQKYLIQFQTERLYLEVQAKNIRAISFYKKLGFEFLCIKKAFYRDGSDAFAMQKELGQACQTF